MKINVGSGSNLQAGYVNVDLYHSAADVQDDARTLATFADGCAEELTAFHVLEHLGQADGPRALAAWYRVLAPGGRLVVEVPDIPQQVRLWLEFYDRGDPRVWGFRSYTLWGNQVHAGEYHKWGYDIHTLRQIITAAGFQDVSIAYSRGLDFDFGELPQGCLRAQAAK
jgi:predicted SAM-dependent methyltransferase